MPPNYLKPFKRLRLRRLVKRPDLPNDLVEFYEQNEGVGLESSADHLVRLCRLDEVAHVEWRDLHIFGELYKIPGWESFSGFRVGFSSFGDEIVYVLECPCCAKGAILTIGIDVPGPKQRLPERFESALVLASTFTGWLRHLARMGWVEYGLVNGYLADLPATEQRELRLYYQALNPGITWGVT
jgi:hypothetical protein